MSPSMLRLLAIAGGIFGVGFVLFLAGSRFYEGITERQEQLEKLQLDETALIGKLARLDKEKREVDHWTAISMPGNINSAALKYKGFLQELLLKRKIAIRSFSEPNRVTSNSRQGTPVVSHISFDIVFEATFAQLTSFLQEFYSLNVPHAIKAITIEPQGKGSDAKLTVTMKVDALSMSNVKDRESVLANPTITIAQLEMLMAIKRLPVGLLFGLSQLTKHGLHGQSKLASIHKEERDYMVMLKKNVFGGLAPKNAITATASAEPQKKADRDILKYTQLTSITANYITEEGLLRVRKTNKYVKLRAEGGVNDFEIRDADNLLVLKGKVLAIKPRDLVFEYDGKAYLLHIGQFVEEALKTPLSAADLKKYDAELTAVEQADQAK